MNPQRVGPPSSMQAFAEAIASASDPELAAWQQHGLAALGSGGSAIVWSIFICSGAIGLATGVAGWWIAWHSVGPLGRPAGLGGARLQDPAILTLLGALLAMLLAAAVGFALFQGLSRLAFRIRR